MTESLRQQDSGSPERVKSAAVRVMGPMLDIPTASERGRRRLVRYSRFVSAMKLILPVVAGLLILLVAVWPQLQPPENRFSVDFGSVRANDESLDPAMIRPRYVGIDNGNMPFSVTADLAKNLSLGSEEIELDMPKADITLKDGTWLAMAAETGIYSRDSKMLALDGGVNLFHDSGYEIRTPMATIELETGSASGDRPVEGHGPFGELRSQGFQLEDKGARILFTGKAKLVLYPGYEDAGE